MGDDHALRRGQRPKLASAKKSRSITSWPILACRSFSSASRPWSPAWAALPSNDQLFPPSRPAASSWLIRFGMVCRACSQARRGCPLAPDGLQSDLGLELSRKPSAPLSHPPSSLSSRAIHLNPLSQKQGPAHGDLLEDVPPLLLHGRSLPFLDVRGLRLTDLDHNRGSDKKSRLT